MKKKIPRESLPAWQTTLKLLQRSRVYLDGAKFSCAGFFLVLGLLVGVAFFAVLVLGFGVWLFFCFGAVL